MLRGLWKLTWLEIKIFLREPLGVIGTLGIPVVVFVLLGRSAGQRRCRARGRRRVVGVDLPIFGVAPDRAERGAVARRRSWRSTAKGGILKRLRATPLRPHTILTAHVIVKLLFTP